MMHRDHRWDPRCGGQLSVQPAEALTVEHSAILAWTSGVEHDQPQRSDVYRVLDWLRAGPRQTEVSTQHKAIVMVAGKDMSRRTQWRQQLAH